MSKQYAHVHLLDLPYHAAQTYEYRIPAEFLTEIVEGSFVVVPFGGDNRRRYALVCERLETPMLKEVYKIKPISSPVFKNLTLSTEMLNLCLYMYEHTFCSIGEAVHTMIPPELFGKMNELYHVVKEPVGARILTAQETIVYNYIKKMGQAPLSTLKADLGNSVMRVLNQLEQNGYIQCDIEWKESGSARYAEHLSLAADEEAVRAALPRLGKKQTIIINALLKEAPRNAQELKEEYGVTTAQIRSLTERGLISVSQTDLYRTPYAHKEIPASEDNILSQSQTEAFERLCALYRTGEAKAALLYGITGSGKTRVIKALMDEVIASGRQVIMLIPEISLTPQTVHYFRSCYGDRIAVVHSSLSAGERFDAWRRMKKGDVDICIGTRSAVFAPFPTIGLIVIDEEQEHTYKSDKNPKYHARDIARFRCSKHNALMLLSSATPSLESYFKATKGVYSLIELKERYGNAQLPQAVIADMRLDASAGRISAIGSVLEAEITNALKDGGQVIVFLNRRGYNNFLACPICGEAIMCSRCSVSLTHHTFFNKKTQEKKSVLLCHYCGHRQAIPSKCPHCESEHLKFMGFGTQKVEEELHERFPDAKIMRMDADTTGSKFAYDDIIERFRAGEADILLGTQMVAKGHDFPNVTLSCVICADMALYLDDYRANERTFAMITQVLGRAGRAEKPGRAVIQTFNPDHPTIQLAAVQDYPAFYKTEIALRQALLFPPFCDIVILTFTGTEEQALLNFALRTYQNMQDVLTTYFCDIDAVFFGPFEAPVYKINDKYRRRIIIKCRTNRRTREFLQHIFTDSFPNGYTTVQLAIDINPSAI